jgi:hypothetical protein
MGDARLDFGLDGRAAMFPDWLVLVAPLHARAFLRQGSPLWNAIFDMRAAALRSNDGDSPGNVWCLNEPEPAFDDLRDILEWLTGVMLPRGLFDAVWQLYCDYLEGVGREDGGCWDAWGRIVSDDYDRHLLVLARDVARHLSRLNSRPGWPLDEALAAFSRERYGDWDG